MYIQAARQILTCTYHHQQQWLPMILTQSRVLLCYVYVYCCVVYVYHLLMCCVYPASPSIRTSSLPNAFHDFRVRCNLLQQLGRRGWCTLYCLCSFNNIGTRPDRSRGRTLLLLLPDFLPLTLNYLVLSICLSASWDNLRFRPYHLPSCYLHVNVYTFLLLLLLLHLLGCKEAMERWFV